MPSASIKKQSTSRPLPQPVTKPGRNASVLRPSEQQYRLLFAANPCPAWVFDEKTLRFLAVNEAAVRLYGWSEPEFLRMTVLDVRPEEDRIRIKGLIREYQGAVSAAVGPMRHQDKSGNLISVEVIVSSVSFDGRPARLCLLRDVTDHKLADEVRKKAEAALRESYENYERQVRLFEGVVSTTPDFVYLFDPQGRFRYANHRLLEVWGMQLAEVIGKTCRELGYEQWHHDMHMREIAQVIKTKKPIKGEVPFKAPVTGIFGVYEYIFTPVIRPDGEVEFIAGTTRDVTERKQAEGVLQRDKAELEQLVLERTAKLRDLVGELEHFSYTLVHDMRAPLRAMRGFAEVIRELSVDRREPELELSIRRMIGSAERMDALITDALNYNQSVRQELPLAPVNVQRLLRGMLDTYPEFLKHGTDINVAGNLPLLMGNEAGLTQCFSNLIGNALKFVVPGETPSVVIRAEAFTDAQSAQPWVRIWVEDTGIGIPPMMLPKVFDMFTRASGNYEGTGIGLALVRKVIQRMGGRVGVESVLGKGSRFYFELRSGELGSA